MALRSDHEEWKRARLTFVSQPGIDPVKWGKIATRWRRLGNFSRRTRRRTRRTQQHRHLHPHIEKGPMQVLLTKYPRVVVHSTPVQGLWMNHVQQWFRILQHKRLCIADFESKDQLRAKLEQFIHEWNQHAHPFNWSKKSVAKIMAEAPALAV